jgi:hypothetical protein
LARTALLASPTKCLAHPIIILYLVAAALALAAVAIRYFRATEMSWGWAAAGVFCLVMGLITWKRGRAVENPVTRDRDPVA